MISNESDNIEISICNNNIEFYVFNKVGSDRQPWRQIRQNDADPDPDPQQPDTVHHKYKVMIYSITDLAVSIFVYLFSVAEPRILSGSSEVPVPVLPSPLVATFSMKIFPPGNRGRDSPKDPPPPSLLPITRSTRMPTLRHFRNRHPVQSLLNIRSMTQSPVPVLHLRALSC